MPSLSHIFVHEPHFSKTSEGPRSSSSVAGDACPLRPVLLTAAGGTRPVHRAYLR